MRNLATNINLAGHDSLYEMLVGLHDDLSDEESMKANSKLVLLLANHIGDTQIISQAIEIVRKTTKN